MENVYKKIKEMKGWAKIDSADCPDITGDYIEGWTNALETLEYFLKKEENKNG